MVRSKAAGTAAAVCMRSKDFHWIRILYMYPDEIDDELIEGMAKLPKVLPYFDIPMQHANDEMLVAHEPPRDKGRGAAPDSRRSARPLLQPTLRTTFIVGFPWGGSRQTMDELLQFVRDVRWDHMGAFTYSPEEDTPGYSMRAGMPGRSEGAQYLDELMKLQEQIALENQQTEDRPRDRGPGRGSGRTDRKVPRPQRMGRAGRRGRHGHLHQ